MFQKYEQIVRTQSKAQRLSGVPNASQLRANANSVHGSLASPPGDTGANNKSDCTELEAGAVGGAPAAEGDAVTVFSGTMVWSPLERKIPPPARTGGRLELPSS